MNRTALCLLALLVWIAAFSSGCTTGCIGDAMVHQTNLGIRGGAVSFASVQADDSAAAENLVRSIMVERQTALNVYTAVTCDGLRGDEDIRAAQSLTTRIEGSLGHLGYGDLSIMEGSILFFSQLDMPARDGLPAYELHLSGTMPLAAAQSAVDAVNPFTARGKDDGWGGESATPVSDDEVFEAEWRLQGLVEGEPINVSFTQQVSGQRF